jgi:nucleoside-diphosphate-sugar epimerase
MAVLAEAADFLARKGESAALRSAIAAAEDVVPDGVGRMNLERCKYSVEFFSGTLAAAETALLAAAAGAGLSAVSLRAAAIYGPHRGVHARIAAGTYRVVARQGAAVRELGAIVVGAARAPRLEVTLPVASGDAGAIAGLVFDARNHERFDGAVVTVTAPSLRDAVLAISDRQGRYRVSGLPPAHYQVWVYYHLIDRGNLEVRRGDVEVRAGAATALDLPLDLVVLR